MKIIFFLIFLKVFVNCFNFYQNYYNNNIINNNNKSPKNYFYVENCDKNSCKFPNICETSNKCKCKEGYYDLNNKKTCDYKQKKLNVLFWLEMILNLGIGHILIGNRKVGISKLIISSISIILFIVILSINNKVSKKKLYLNLLSILFSFTSFFFYIIDFILIYICNNYNDNNNVPLI